MQLATRLIPIGNAVGNWLDEVQRGVSQTAAEQPWLFYGFDWLAFAHIVLALFFIGPYREPVKNKWVVECGIYACSLSHAPGDRIPFWWRRGSLGIFGMIPLCTVLKKINRLEETENQSTFMHLTPALANLLHPYIFLIGGWIAEGAVFNLFGGFGAALLAGILVMMVSFPSLLASWIIFPLICKLPYPTIGKFGCWLFIATGLPYLNAMLLLLMLGDPEVNFYYQSYYFSACHAFRCNYNLHSCKNSFNYFIKHKFHQMKQIWFKKAGWIYLPVHPAGFLATLSAIAFMIPVCTSAIRNTHSVSDFLYEVFVYGTCTVFWWKWLAEKTAD
ncbi:MAG: hypothetical protein IPP73_09045 [Chitinophagaceae bacterium]|nr:hypothetical protein [Chitinophagaceae bacterium]